MMNKLSRSAFLSQLPAIAQQAAQKQEPIQWMVITGDDRRRCLVLVSGSDTVEVDEKDLRALHMEGYIRLEPPAASAGEIHVTNKGRRP